MQAYYIKFNEVFDQANRCFQPAERMSERERKQHFLKGLTREEKNIYLDLNFDSLIKFVELYEEIKLKKYLYEVDTPYRNSRDLEEGIKNLSINNKSYLNKYCFLHKVKTHNADECRTLNYKRSSNNSYSKSPAKDNKSFSNTRSFFIDASQKDTLEKLELDGHYNNREMKITLDTGSKYNFISEDKVDAKDTQLISETSVKVANNYTQKVIKKAEISFSMLQIPGTTFKISALVLPTIPTDLIVGLNFLVEQNAHLDFENYQIKINGMVLEIPRGKQLPLAQPEENFKSVMLTKTFETTLNGVLNYYKRNENKYGLIPNIKHSIQLKENVLIDAKPYQIPFYLRSDIQKEIQRLLYLKFIRKSFSSFSSPCFPIRKANGDLRLVIDFRKLKSFTYSDPFPLPRVDELYTRLKEASIFSRIDMKNGYYLIKIRACDVEKTGFVTPWGHYEFIRMPFGLTTAPWTFLKAVTFMFEKEENILVYLYDLMLFRETPEEHLELIPKTFKILKRNNILINRRKCKFFLTRIKYLGAYVLKDKLESNIDFIRNKLGKNFHKQKNKCKGSSE